MGNLGVMDVTFLMFSIKKKTELCYGCDRKRKILCRISVDKNVQTEVNGLFGCDSSLT